MKIGDKVKVTREYSSKKDMVGIIFSISHEYMYIGFIESGDYDYFQEEYLELLEEAKYTPMPTRSDLDILSQSLDQLEELEKKATPTKPTNIELVDNEPSVAICGCGKEIYSFENYCYECGQHIDWGKENE